MVTKSATEPSGKGMPMRSLPAKERVPEDSTRLSEKTDLGQTPLEPAREILPKRPEAISRYLLSPSRRIFFNPEYRHTEHTLTVPTFRRPELLMEQAEIAQEILDFGQFTGVTVFVHPSINPERAKAEFLKLRPALAEHIRSGRLRFIVGEKVREGAYWGQDHGQSAGRSSPPRVGAHSLAHFVSGVPDRPYFESSVAFSFPTSTAGRAVHEEKVPLLMEGGDIATTTVNGRSVVVVGPETVYNTKSYYRQLGYENVSTDDIRRVVKKAFNADSVVLLENSHSVPPKYAFHIDQAVCFPKDGVAIMLDPDSLEESEGVLVKYGLVDTLRAYEQQLKKRGFKVIRIPTTPEHVKGFQSYTNAIPLSDPFDSTRRTRLIMPSFGDYALEGRIATILKREGMQVKFVRDVAYRLQGNVHCLAGTLAENEADPTPNENSST